MAKYRRTAEWIWRQRDLKAGKSHEELVNHERNRFVFFRKEVELIGDQFESTVNISADGRYIAFVNGHRVGRGVARCSPEWQSYDTNDLKPYLRAGRNVIAAVVHSYGRDTAWYELPRWEAGTAFGCGGWFLQGTVKTAGNTTRLDTDDSWRCLCSDAWRQDTRSGRVGFAEELDARKLPQGWMLPGFDDSAWESAQILRTPGDWGGPDVIPFPVMVARDIPFPIEELRLPTAICLLGEVVDRPGPMEDAVSSELIEPLSRCHITGADSLLHPPGEAVITTSEGRSISLVLDFGRTQQGRICFSADGPAGAVIDIRFGERLAPDARIEIQPWSWPEPGGHYIQTHRVILPGGPFEWEMFDYGGFRYVQATVRNCHVPLRLQKVAVNFTSYPVGDRGQFTCNDPLLNDIYRISAYTLQCCMLDSYQDGPSREQRQWTNDQYIHLTANYAMFGDKHLARRLLMQVAQSQRPDGQVMMCAPGDYSSCLKSNMSEFTLHWIMSFAPYVLYTGDESLLRDLYPNIIKGIVWAELHMNDDDLLDSVSGILWIDWAEIDKKGELTEINCRFVGCLRIVADIADRLGVAHDAERFRSLADRVSTAVNKHLWDETRGVYVDARHKGVLSRRVSQQSNVAAMFFDVAPRNRWDRILSYILDEKRLVMTNAAGVYGKVSFDNERDVVLSHAFYMHFLHAVLNKVERHVDLLNNIRQWWGPQARTGACTWAEAWVVEPIHTLCHAFMCTPGYDLPTYVLGIRPLAPGFARFAVAPQTGDLTSASGIVPCMHGDISVAWKLSETAFELTVHVPEGAIAELSLPKLSGDICGIKLDQAATQGCTFSVGAGIHRLTATGRNIAAIHSPPALIRGPGYYQENRTD